MSIKKYVPNLVQPIDLKSKRLLKDCLKDYLITVCQVESTISRIIVCIASEFRDYWKTRKTFVIPLRYIPKTGPFIGLCQFWTSQEVNLN